ncbi:Panacea domain-containing protein [Arcicella rigui]|uniref:Panacea domain-containing protein n=1 Tax=Arcicella rigui TaxID=797020 RepID=A0ABU5Q847_9BACT|nr:Panacea domain-containing protein [Arcicella rigui]MEA5139021.1 Panacea domain-containing protein [Arcicella rigui]
MQQFKFDREKCTSVLLYITKNLEKADFLRVFKVLYFAEKEHLARFGRPIVGDSYIAMKHGPVPSTIYAELGNIRSGIGKIIDGVVNNNISFSDYFEVKPDNIIIAKVEPDVEDFSASEQECLDKSLNENKDLSFNELSEKSHDLAWNRANMNDEMDILDIAESGGASKEMLQYISVLVENENLSFV